MNYIQHLVDGNGKKPLEFFFFRRVLKRMTILWNDENHLRMQIIYYYMLCILCGNSTMCNHRWKVKNGKKKRKLCTFFRFTLELMNWNSTNQIEDGNEEAKNIYGNEKYFFIYLNVYLLEKLRDTSFSSFLFLLHFCFFFIICFFIAFERNILVHQMVIKALISIWLLCKDKILSKKKYYF